MVMLSFFSLEGLLNRIGVSRGDGSILLITDLCLLDKLFGCLLSLLKSDFKLFMVIHDHKFGLQKFESRFSKNQNYLENVFIFKNYQKK